MVKGWFLGARGGAVGGRGGRSAVGVAKGYNCREDRLPMIIKSNQPPLHLEGSLAHGCQLRVSFL
jgi:hypothetical protein